MFPIYQCFVDSCRANTLFVMYFWLGFCLSAPSIIVQYTFVNSFHLGVVELAEVSGLISIAWAIKPIIGAMVDRLSRYVSPKFQISFSYCCSGLSISCINLNPSLWLFIACLFLSSFFLASADVIQDSLMVSSIRNSSTARRGIVQSNVWVARSVGSIFGCFLSAFFAFHNNRFAIVAIIHLGGVFSAFHLQVNKNTIDRKKKLSIKEVFLDRSVILFSILLFFFAYEPGDSSIFEYQLLKKFKVKPGVLASAQITAYAMILLASFCFKQLFRKWNPISVATVPSILSLGIFISRNLFLTQRIRIPVNVFFIGNVTFDTFLAHLSFLPLAVIATSLCKPGVEATMYAYFMAFTNFASIVSRELSGALADVIGIRKQLNLETEKIDLFYGICILLDIIGIFVVYILYYRVPITTGEKREIELTEFDHEMEEEDLINIDSEAVVNRDSDLVDIDLH